MKTPKSIKNVNYKAVLRRSGIYTQQIRNKQLKEAAMPLAKQMLTKKAVEQKYSDFTNEIVDAYVQRQIRIIHSIEDKFEAKLVQFIDNIVKDFLVNIDTEVKGYFDDYEEELIVKGMLDFTPLLNTVSALAGNEANKLIGLDTPYIASDYKKIVSDNVRKFVGSMIQTDQDKLTNIISTNLAEGKGIPAIRDQITKDFAEYSKMQANRIARTEVARASTQASIDAWEQSGVVEGLEWVIFGAVDECANYDGEIKSFGEGFYESSEFADGNPPLHPNCLCQLIPVVIGTKAFKTDQTKLGQRIVELEAEIDKRTKAYKEIKELRADDLAYIKALEGLTSE